MDAILTVGGGLNEDGSINAWTQHRLDKAIELYDSKSSPIICLSRATPYKPPPLDEKGFPIDESYAQAQYLMSHGVEPEYIRTESVSFDTTGNAYFSRVLFVDPLDLINLTVITSEFHMVRTKLAFTWVYGLSPKNKYIFNFVSVSDNGMEPELIASRILKEKAGIERLKHNIRTIVTYSQLHEWIYTKHGSYAAKRNVDKINESVKKSY